MTVNKPVNMRGPSYWKFNYSLLKEAKYSVFESEINKFENGREQLSKGQLWDFLKIKFKEFTQKFSKKMYIKRKNKLKEIEKQITDIDEKIFEDPTSEVLLILLISGPF